MVVDDISKLRHRYVRSTAFKLDMISLLPTDFVFLVSYQSHVIIARINRLLRIYTAQSACTVIPRHCVKTPRTSAKEVEVDIRVSK